MKTAYDIVRNDAQILEILALQKLNLKTNISNETQLEQGFLTVNHSRETLEIMTNTIAQIIALAQNKIVGYALSMSPSLEKAVPELQAMFELFNQINYKGKAISDYNYYAMGQICVDEQARGQGVFDGLYKKHAELFAQKYDFIITEVSIKNTRSMRAHERVGFQKIHEYYDTSNNDTWAVVLWDWQ
jgi:ribosomal protein S18 acetylase RimI-like enzyme